MTNFEDARDPGGAVSEGGVSAESASRPRRTAEEIEEWLVSYLSRLLETPPDKIATKTADFGKPVLLINGDSHNYRSDNPLVPGATCVVEAPATATVGAPLVAATAAVACSDASVASVAAAYHTDAPGIKDPYTNQPNGYNVPNFHRIVTHTNPANPMEYLRLTVNSNANAANDSNAFGPFSWTRVKP